MADARARTKLTYDDYLLLPEDGRRHEIIDGEHVVNAAPNPWHQEVCLRLAVQLFRQIVEAGRGKVFVSPIDLLLSPVDVVEPDILVIMNRGLGRILDTRIEGVPDLVMEVLSPSTASRDRILKAKLYETAGIPEYWIVDPERCVVHQHVFGRTARAASIGQSESVTAATIPGVVIDLEMVFRRD